MYTQNQWKWRDEQRHSPSSPGRGQRRQGGKEAIRRLQGKKENLEQQKKRRGTENSTHRVRTVSPAGRHDAPATPPPGQRAETWRRAGSWRHRRARPWLHLRLLPIQPQYRPALLPSLSPFSGIPNLFPSDTSSGISGMKEFRSANTTGLADTASRWSCQAEEVFPP